MILALARNINYDCNHSFIELATVITIINYDRKTYIVQATLVSQYLANFVLVSLKTFCNHCFIVLATVIMIVNYDRKTFTVQATSLAIFSQFFF
jgi:hypothetical protein